MSEWRVLLVGLGNLGAHIFDLLVRIPGRHTFLVGGRDVAYLRERTNLSVFAAMQLRYSPHVSCTAMDLWNKEHTAETIARFRPDIIICAATLQRTEAIYDLPQAVSKQLVAAQLGPRLPLHLTLIYQLMQAIHMTGLQITVLNAIYPDVVGPVLHQVGLAPTTGVGDLANNIPALRQSVALHLNAPVEQIDLRLVMARYISYWMTRRALEEKIPYHLTALIKNEAWPHSLDLRNILRPLFTSLKRTGGITGLLMTAASAAVVFDGLVNNTGVITHAPGPNGLPGGYPIQVNAEGIKLVLPDGVSLDTAIQINKAGLRFDGIENIEEDGSVVFTEEHMAIMKKTLGYFCKRMPLSETEYWAKELQAKYEALAKR